MSSPHTDSTVYPTVTPPYQTHVTTDETTGAHDPTELIDLLRKACGRIANQPTTPDDALPILQILGLLPSPPPTNPQRRKH